MESIQPGTWRVISSYMEPWEYDWIGAVTYGAKMRYALHKAQTMMNRRVDKILAQGTSDDTSGSTFRVCLKMYWESDSIMVFCLKAVLFGQHNLVRYLLRNHLEKLLAQGRVKMITNYLVCLDEGPLLRDVLWAIPENRGKQDLFYESVGLAMRLRKTRVLETLKTFPMTLKLNVIARHYTHPDLVVHQDLTSTVTGPYNPDEVGTFIHYVGGHMDWSDHLVRALHFEAKEDLRMIRDSQFKAGHGGRRLTDVGQPTCIVVQDNGMDVLARCLSVIQTPTQVQLFIEFIEPVILLSQSCMRVLMSMAATKGMPSYLWPIALLLVRKI